MYLCFCLFHSWIAGWIIYSLKNHKKKSELSHIQLLDFSIMNFPLLPPNSKYTVGVSWPCLCLRGNNASQLNYSDRPALFTHKEDEEGMGEQSAELVVEEGSWRNNANKWGGSEGRRRSESEKTTMGTEWGKKQVGARLQAGCRAVRLAGWLVWWEAVSSPAAFKAGTMYVWPTGFLTNSLARWFGGQLHGGLKGWLAASAAG